MRFFWGIGEIIGVCCWATWQFRNFINLSKKERQNSREKEKKKKIQTQSPLNSLAKSRALRTMLETLHPLYNTIICPSYFLSWNLWRVSLRISLLLVYWKYLFVISSNNWGSLNSVLLTAEQELKWSGRQSKHINSHFRGGGIQNKLSLSSITIFKMSPRSPL